MGRTRTQSSSSLVLDAGALIALDRGNKRMIALLQHCLAGNISLRIPAGVLGQVWRSPRTQVILARFLRTDLVEVVPLDDQLARASGELCAATQTSDVIDASVVLLAGLRKDPIVTGDVDDLRRLDPSARLIPI